MSGNRLIGPCGAAWDVTGSRGGRASVGRDDLLESIFDLIESWVQCFAHDSKYGLFVLDEDDEHLAPLARLSAGWSLVLENKGGSIFAFYDYGRFIERNRGS
jgi:hypothetical protein